MSDVVRWKTLGLGLLGAVVGGVLGYFAFFSIAQQGFYALILPPVLLGYGAGLCAGRRSTELSIICAVAGLGLGLFTEWRFAPFLVDASFEYFIKHIHKLKPVTLVMIALGTYFSYRFALGRDPRTDAV